MSMSASQARLISLKARQSNLEYHGQQINQERSILSQQVTDLYNSLLALEVPTPPSTSDFTKVTYSGVDGATPFTIGDVTPSGTNSYTITMNIEQTGHFMEDAGQVQATPIPAQVNLSTIPTPTIVTTAKKIEGNTTTNPDTANPATSPAVALHYEATGVVPSGATNFYAELNGYLVPMSDEAAWKDFQGEHPEAKLFLNFDPIGSGHVWDATQDYYFSDLSSVSNSEILGYSGEGPLSILNGRTYIMPSGNNSVTLINENNINIFFTKLDDNSYQLKTAYAGYSVGSIDNENGLPYDNNGAANGVCGTIGSITCYSLDSLPAIWNVKSKTMDNYIKAIRSAFPEDTLDMDDSQLKNAYGAYMSTDAKTGVSTIRFFNKAELTNGITYSNTVFLPVFEYIANGKYTTAQEQENCLLTFDQSGRITAVKIPNYDNDGNITSYNTIELEANTQTDDKAYQDAFNKYEYAKFEYDRVQQEINTKTQVIQEQDRNLELKLTRLDNERKQITTEIDAVQKVIDENIEKTFKTFAG